MKTLFFTTGTRDCEKLWQSYINLGHETHVMRYDVPGINMVEVAKAYAPEVIIYIGAIGDFHFGLPVPSPDVLEAVGRVAPMVHLCSDAADPPWWDLLNEYFSRRVFAVQVTIDGCSDSPMGGRATDACVALTPIDPGMFHPRPWHNRIYDCGFVGGGGVRIPMIRDLQSKVPLTWYCNGQEVPYSEMCGFYSDCRVVWNAANTGSNAKRHVKGRVVEAGLAGAVLIEPDDSPLKQWFESGVDYLSWGDLDEAAEWIKYILNNPSMGEAMAARFHQKMVKYHAAGVFWDKVLGMVKARELCQSA
jgi:hypothetical protein